MNDFSWNNNCINSSDTSLLVIDDDPKDLQLICDLLRGYGLSMLTTHQGSGSLLEQIRDSHPAMILLDTQISGIDAFDICRMLKADETLRHIPVIFLSASSAARERRKVFQHGADDLIFKPIQREEFLAKVITQLSHTCRDITDRKQTEADVRFSEHRFRTILETTDQGFWEINEDGRTMDVNPATCALLGKNRDEIIGHYVTDFLDEKSAEEFIRQMRIRGAGLSSSYELSFHREDGSIVRCMIKETRFFDENGKRAGSFAMLTDITEPRRLEEAHLAQMNFLESLERIDQTLRGATDLDKMLHESMETVQSIFQSDRTWLLYPCDPNAPTYRVPVEHARPEYPGALAMDLDVPMKPGADGVCIDTLGSEDPVTYGPSKSDRPLYKEVMEQFGVLSQMIMAIYPKIGKPWMFGMHQCSHAREWTAHEKRLFKEIGRRIADGLSSTLSLRDLQEREARLQSILGTSPAGIGLVSDRVFLNLNKRICEMVDRSHEELFQQNTRILYPNDREYEAVGEILYGQGQGKGAIETKWIRKEGEIIDVLLTSSPIDPSDLSKGITMIALDITERKRLERIERHANAVTKAIAEASLSYLETGSVETMAQLIVEHASRVIGSQIGILVDLEEEQDVRILAVTAMTWETMKGRDLYNKAREEIEEKGFYSLPFVRNLIFAPMREGVPVISNDPKNHPSWAGRMPEGHPAIESFLGVPMRIGEHLVGLLALANRPGGFSDQQLREAEAFANTAALALRIARSEEERLQVEMQLKQAQKMEAIGQLAGGIAHDFNNLLTSILGYNELVLEGVSADDPLKECLYYIQEAGHRAALLTNQLLAFSRRQLLQPIDLNLNHLIRDLLNLLRRIIQENIELEVIPGHNLGTVHADPNQIEQVLMNVVVNARDAMPEGGHITIETENVAFDSQYVKTHLWARKGRYVLLSITDTGCGMDEKSLSHIFEPFFTTKEKGKGTGLGLSMAYGIIKQHNGTIQAYSEPGKGTAIKIYLPIVERRAVDVGSKITTLPAGGTETILLAEDEEMVRDLAARILEKAGYRVLQACDGEEALRLFKAHIHAIHLVLLDVVMPKMGGRSVMEAIRSIKPDIRVLFMSGYSANAVHTGFVMDKGMQLIMKPYDSVALLSKVREVIDA